MPTVSQNSQTHSSTQWMSEHALWDINRWIAGTWQESSAPTWTKVSVPRVWLVYDMKRKSKVTTSWRSSVAEAQASDVGKTKSVSLFDGEDNHLQAHLANQLPRGSAQHHFGLTRLVWITLFHSLFQPPCSAYHHHAWQGWFKTYTFRFKKLMLGLGWVIIFSSMTQWRIRAEIKKAGELTAPLFDSLFHWQ